LATASPANDPSGTPQQAPSLHCHTLPLWVLGTAVRPTRGRAPSCFARGHKALVAASTWVESCRSLLHPLCRSRGAFENKTSLVTKHHEPWRPQPQLPLPPLPLLPHQPRRPPQLSLPPLPLLPPPPRNNRKPPRLRPITCRSSSMTSRYVHSTPRPIGAPRLRPGPGN